MKSQSNGMVNQSLQANDTAAAPNGDRSLAILAVPSRHRPAIETLFALDARLAGIVRATREPMVGQMRLTWWHEALTKLDGAPAPAEPLLRDVQQHLLPAGVSGARLAGMIDGWEELIVADALGAETLDRHAGPAGPGCSPRREWYSAPTRRCSCRRGGAGRSPISPGICPRRRRPGWPRTPHDASCRMLFQHLGQQSCARSVY